MTLQLLIDADFTLYQACAAVEREGVFTNEAGSPVHILSSSRDEALEVFSRNVAMTMERLRGDEAVLVFSGPNNFRKEVWDGYKEHRKATRKPLCYWSVIDELREAGEYRVVSEDCLEGDDYIGILATRPSSVDRLIVAEDKDMLTLPNVRIYRQGGIVETDPDSADEFWMLQTLMGDSTDGYKGCPGLGEKSAKTVLSKPGDPWENVLAAYRKAYTEKNKPRFLDRTPEELALLNARLARILRFTDWDGKARRPILWTPNEPF